MTCKYTSSSNDFLLWMIFVAILCAWASIETKIDKLQKQIERKADEKDF